jgi:hypothetical protein
MNEAIFCTTNESFFDIKKDGKECIVFITRIHNNIDVVQTVIRQEVCPKMCVNLETKSLEFNLN